MIVTVLVNGLWMGAIIVALTALVLRLVPAGNATTRYAAWFAALLALVAVPLLTAEVHLGLHLIPAPPAGPLAGGRFSLVALAPAAVGPNVTTAVAAVWIAGAIAALTRLAWSFGFIARVRRSAREVSRIEGVPVLLSHALSIPIATGVFAPAIVVPKELVDGLSADDLRCTLEHELAHLRRGDVVTNAIARIVEALFFWNPWVHLVGRQLVEEREAACDDRATVRLGDGSNYAAALAELGRRLTRSPLPLLTPSAFGSRHALVARIERLMAERAPGFSKLNYVAVGGIIMLFAVATLVFETLITAPAQATTVANPANAAVVAAACKNPNAAPEAIDPTAPDLPKAQWPSHKETAIVAVTVSPDGRAAAAKIYRSSGDPNLDRAVLAAAEKSRYSPQLSNCTPVQGAYLFRADFAP
jgi:TonB family protein